MLYIVTGCAGFIGSTLVDSLLEDGEEVIGIDCFRDFYAPSIKRRNLESALGRTGFALMEMDLARDRLPAPAELTGGKPFIIFHLAEQPGGRRSWGREFGSYTRDNITATQRLLEWCLEADGLRNFVFASSSSVYGNSESLPMREDVTVPRPFSPYGVSKLAAENLVTLYHGNYGIPSVSCRFFTVYGPRQRPDMAFHRFILALLDGNPLTVFGNGRQTRDFTFVKDIVAGLRSAESRTAGEVFNLGGGNRVSLISAIETVQKVTGVEAEVSYVEPERGDVKDSWASTDKARRNIDWFPVTTLEDGLASEAEWLQRLMREAPDLL